MYDVVRWLRGYAIKVVEDDEHIGELRIGGNPDTMIQFEEVDEIDKMIEALEKLKKRLE